jgi:hypothetical protein
MEGMMAWRDDTEGQSTSEPATSRRGQPLGPGYLLLRDADGLRHAIKVNSIHVLSDGDSCCDTMVAVVAGRSLIPQPLKELLAQMSCRRLPASW